MVSQFPIDVMYQIDLGVTKFLLYAFKGRKHSGTPSRQNFKELDKKFKEYSKYTPRDFPRKPRSLNEMYNFKAAEYRQIILYTGLVLFKPYLSTPLYHHLLLLVCAYRTLSGNDFEIKLDIVNGWFSKFVPKFRTFYTKVGINVHNLLHLTDCVKIFGSINSFSSYKFENHIQKISRLVRGKKLDINQISNRLAEWRRLNFKFGRDGCSKKYERFYKNNGRDCYVGLSEERLGKIVGVSGDQYLVKIYESKTNLFSYPIPSSEVGIHVVKTFEEGTLTVRRHEFTNKYYGLPQTQSMVLIRLL